MINLPLKKEEIYTYSPHKKDMLLLDSLDAFSFEDATLDSSIDIKPNTMFFDEKKGIVPAWISFEYMGQSIALLSGLYGSRKGEKPKIGFIMAIREFDIHSPGFNCGDTVFIKVKQIFRDGDVAVFKGTAQVNDKIITEGTLSTIAASEELLKRMKG